MQVNLYQPLIKMVSSGFPLLFFQCQGQIKSYNKEAKCIPITMSIFEIHHRWYLCVSAAQLTNTQAKDTHPSTNNAITFQ